MTVKIPLEVQTSGLDKLKEIKEGISEVKKDIEEIETQVESSEQKQIQESTADNTSQTPSEKSEKSDTASKKETANEERTSIDKALEQDLGYSQAQNIINYGTNPTGALLQQLFKMGALPAALLGGPEIAAKLIDIFQQEGQFLDRFFNDKIDNRTDALRDKQTQQQVLQGFEALRISTIDGNFDPRNVYNTFEVFENNRTLLENDFKIRTDIR